MQLGILVAIIAAIAGPLGAYLLAARKLSGKIKTSEATELWEESRSIRQDLVERNKYLRDVIDKCETKIQLLEERINLLEEKNEKLHLENGELKKENEALSKELTRARSRIKQLESRVKELEKENGR